MLLSRLLLSPLAAAPLARAARRCYKVNGELEANDVPCYVDESKDSHCCGDIAGCNTNRVCSDLVHGDLGRGSCTDPTWKSPECPSFCHDEAAGEPIDGGAQLFPCADAQPLLTQFCCRPSNTTCNCQTGQGVVTLPGPPLPLSIASTAGVSSAASSTGNATASTGAAAAANTTNAAAAGSAGSSVSPVAVGAGVGVPLGVLLLAALAFIVWRERRSRRQGEKEGPGIERRSRVH